MATKNSKLTRAAKAAALVEDDYLLATHGLAVAGDAQTPPLRPRVGGTFPECRMSKPAEEASHLTAASRLIDAAIVLEKSKGDTSGPSKGSRVELNPEAADRARVADQSPNKPHSCRRSWSRERAGGCSDGIVGLLAP